MKKIRSIKWILISSLLHFSFLTAATTRETHHLLGEANRSYQQGEQAQTLMERKQAFNRALYLYLTIKEKLPSITQSAPLNAAIANSYFQVGQYSQSILYNYRALAIKPDQPLTKAHLQLSQEKLGILTEVYPSLWNQILSFNETLMLPQRLELFFWIACLTFIGYSGLLYFNHRLIHLLTKTSLIITLLLLGNLLSSFYFTPIEAVLIAPTGLYQAPNEQAPQLSAIPLMAGIKVDVVDILEQGYWLKIRTVDGEIGYIFVPSARII